MGVEIVLNQHDLICAGKDSIGKVFEDKSVIDRGTALANGDMAPAFRRGKQHEQAGHTGALVFIVEAHFAPGPHRDRRAILAGQLLAGLVQADQRLGLVLPHQIWEAVI